MNDTANTTLPNLLPDRISCGEEYHAQQTRIMRAMLTANTFSYVVSQQLRYSQNTCVTLSLGVGLCRQIGSCPPPPPPPPLPLDDTMLQKTANVRRTTDTARGRFAGLSDILLSTICAITNTVVIIEQFLHGSRAVEVARRSKTATAPSIATVLAIIGTKRAQILALSPRKGTLECNINHVCDTASDYIMCRLSLSFGIKIVLVRTK